MKFHRYFLAVGLILIMRETFSQDTEYSFSSVLEEILPQDGNLSKDNKGQDFSLIETSPVISMNQISLKCLDKITAHVQQIKVKIGEKITFGTLEITARSCHKSAPEDSPDFIAYLEIIEKKYQQSDFLVFKGWMFASSPAISAIEHPVYDIWIQSCNN